MKKKKQVKIKQTKANLFFLIVGRLVIYGAFYTGAIMFFVWAFQQITVYK